MPLVAGFDSSTQSTKVEIRDADDGALVAVGRAPHPSTSPPRSEQHPHDWWAALESAYAAAGTPAVAALSVAAQQHGLVALDDDDAVIRPAKLWNDTESAPDADWLIDQLGGEEAAVAACGSVPVASFTVTKLSWLHRNEPAAWARVARVLLPHDWLTWRLTNRFVTDRGDASGTGYWSPAAEAWNHDVLGLVDGDRDWAAALPAVLGPREQAGKWRGAIVGPGTGDNMAAAIGAGLQPGDVAVSLGTSGTVFAVSDTPAADATGAVAGFADATGRWLPLVCTLNAMKVTDAIARLLGVGNAAFDALALDAPAGADGLVLLPYFDGERTPNRPDATGVLGGLRTDVTREAVARAAVEGVICALLDGIDALEGAGIDVGGGRLLLVGGGARSAAFRQILADLAGRVVTVPTADEYVAAGAAVQAAAVMTGGSVEQVAADWRLGTGDEVEPRAVDRAGIRQRYAAVRDGA